jgi:Ni,Fe-hydrogenase III component G
MNIKEVTKTVLEMNINNREVIESVEAIHGENVARCMAAFADHNKGLTAVMSLLASAKFPKKLCTMVVDSLQDDALSMISATMAASGKDEKDVKELVDILHGIVDRQQGVLEKLAKEQF